MMALPVFCHVDHPRVAAREHHTAQWHRAVWLGLLLCACLLAWVPQVHAASRAAATVTMNFVNADIEGVARAVSAIVNRQILVDPRVKGTVTLYSEQPVTPREAYLSFLSALRGQGFALVEVSGLLKVVPEADAKLQAGTVGIGNRPTRSGDVVLTQIYRLQYENANSMVTVLRPLISPNNTINANPTTNTLVITDYADNLKRIGQIIAALDVPSTGDMEVIPLQHTVATDIAAMVQRINAADTASGAAGAGGASPSLLVMADTRSNALLVKTPNTARLAAIRKLVAQLDRPSENGVGGSGIYVVYLKNADATKLAQILRAAFPSAGGGSGSASSSAPSTGIAAQAVNPPGANNTGASSQSTTPVSASAGPSTGGNIQADPASNSLIITAPEAVYRQLRAVIDQLDGRRAQIYIEAMIVSVNAEKFAQVGVQWQNILGREGDRNVIAAGTNLPLSAANGVIPSLIGASASGTAAGTSLASASGLNIGVVHDFGDGQYGLAALANFLQTKADANVLSTPNLVVLDNEEAKIVSGQNVPVPTGQYTNANSSGGNTVNPFTTVDRKDVGLTLRVKPQIGEGGTIRLTVFQENSNVERESKDGPITSKSSLETSVVVDNGTLLVLGGLIKDTTRINEQKVPLLGDLPGVGRLFRSENRNRTKENLMVFLRPVVMRSQDDSNSLTSERYEYMRRQQKVINPESSVLLPLDGGNRLPRLNLPSTGPVPSPFLQKQNVTPASSAAKP